MLGKELDSRWMQEFWENLGDEQGQQHSSLGYPEKYPE